MWPFSSDDDKKGDTWSHISEEARAYLESEAPRKPSRNQFTSDGTPAPDAKPFDPTEFSKYGKKYADIWANYKPLEMVNAEGRTPSMAIHDVYESYSTRRTLIGRAALENCVFEQLALNECWNPGMIKKFTGCKEENRVFDNCYKSQQNFLKTLGYKNDINRDPEVDDKIQMHADKLYREQIAKEKKLEENSAAGIPLDS
ncbi:hypothetical protein BZA77DRAFT_308327, partial [Pyronema omphalodes]